MVREKYEIYQGLSDGVFLMDEELALHAAREVVAAGYDAYEAINQGLVVGMDRASAAYENGDYFVPELLLCADALYAGMAILQPHIPVGALGAKHKAVIGVVEGDTHDIGKNLVRIMMDVAGFEMYDLGRDIPPAAFVAKAKEVGARFICLSTLMSTTMSGMAEVIDLLVREGIRDQVKVLVGGGPISDGFAHKIGADGYADNATGAVALAKGLLEP